MEIISILFFSFSLIFLVVCVGRYLYPFCSAYSINVVLPAAEAPVKSVSENLPLSTFSKLSKIPTVKVNKS